MSGRPFAVEPRDPGRLTTRLEPGDPGPIRTVHQHNNKPVRCSRPPKGWICYGDPGHAGPCAAWPEQRASLGPIALWLLVIVAAAFAAGFIAGTFHSTQIRSADSLAAPRAAEIAKAASLDAGPTPSSTDAATPPSSDGAGDRAAPAPRVRPTVFFIRAAAERYDVDPAFLERIAACESSLDRLAIGRAQELGLFQWKPTSWEFIARVSGLGYSIERIFDEAAQAEMAAWAISHGYASWWTCAR
jgi:transglycosylase-like protein with SLT domain